MIETILSFLLLGFVVPNLSLYHVPSMTVISYPNGSNPESLLGFSTAYLNKRLFISAPKVGKFFDYDILKKTDLKEISLPFNEDNYDNSSWLGAVLKIGSTFLVTQNINQVPISTYNFLYTQTFNFIVEVASDRGRLTNWLYFDMCSKKEKKLTVEFLPPSCSLAVDCKKWFLEMILSLGTPGYAITRGSCYTITGNTVKQMPDIPQHLINYFSNYGLDTSGWSVEIDPEDKILIGSPAISLGDTDGVLALSEVITIDSDKTIIIDDVTGSIKKFPQVHLKQRGIVKLYKNSNDPPLVLVNTTKTVNFGYAIASGYFLSGNETSYAISSTYGHYGEGMVFIINKLNEEILRLSGNDVGASYGSVLCKVHLNGKKSSLLVGSPTFSENANQYDNGAVYVYNSEDGAEDLKLKRIIVGQKTSGNFGLAIISLGDMDGDQKDEVAIGAPYEDDLKGAVYIYSGSSLLTGKTWLQRIQPEKYRSFGLSLVSLDNCYENGCNELAVGAPFSDRVFILKCNNYITLKLSAVFPNLQSRTNETFFNFTTCIKVDLPKKHNTINSKIFIKIELMHPDAVLEQKDGTLIFTLDSKSFYCNNVTVLTPTGGNYDALIAYKISASLNDEPSPKYSRSRILFSERSELSIAGELFAANCKNSTTKCMPNLNATLLSNIPEPYIVGSVKVNFSLAILNVGETAYAACVLVSVFGANVLRLPNTCTRHDGNENLMCKSQKPMHTNDVWELNKFEIDTNSLTSKHDNIIIQYTVYNHCNNDESKQEYERTFSLGYDEAGIAVTGVSNPSGLVNLTSADLAIETPFEHMYMITNNGSTHWVGVRCEILLEKRKNLNYKVYILRGRTTSSSCDIMEGETNNTAICDIGDLQHNQIVNVIINVVVLPNSLDDIITTQDVMITTQIAVQLRENQKIQSVTTTLTLLSKSVPVWIPVVSSLLALLIIFVIIFILYKKKYFVRKNKQELENLKASIQDNNSRNQQERLRNN